MTQWHRKSRKKPSGGIRHTLRRMDKKLYQKGRDFSATKLSSKEKRQKIRTEGGNLKIRAKEVKFANLLDKKTKKIQKAEILTVKESKANRQYARANIITKGSILAVKTAEGEKLAKVSSRPGQSGTLDAILLSDSEANALQEAMTKKPKKKFEKKRGGKKGEGEKGESKSDKGGKKDEGMKGEGKEEMEEEAEGEAGAEEKTAEAPVLKNVDQLEQAVVQKI